MRRALIALAVAAVVALTMAWPTPPPKQPPPCHRHGYCATPTSPKPPTVVKRTTSRHNHCHVLVVRHRKVTWFWRWDTHLCRWVKCHTTTVTVVLKRHKSHCGPGHHHVKLPKAGTTTSTSCSVAAECKS